MLTKKEIENIIVDEVIVDCYDEQEVKMGWAIFMTDNINYPFEAEYDLKKASGGTQKEKVQVIGNESSESNFSMDAFYVQIEVNGMVMPADIEKLKIIDADETTRTTLQVWKHRHSY